MIKAAAKGFISLGLRETHAVAIMAANCPEWFATSYASIFAGGLPCGIYPTSSPEIASYICQNASADILMLDDLDLLIKMINGRGNVSDAFFSVKYVILVNANEDDIKKGNFFKVQKFRFSNISIFLGEILLELSLNFILKAMNTEE